MFPLHCTSCPLCWSGDVNDFAEWSLANIECQQQPHALMNFLTISRQTESRVYYLMIEVATIFFGWTIAVRLFFEVFCCTIAKIKIRLGESSGTVITQLASATLAGPFDAFDQPPKRYAQSATTHISHHQWRCNGASPRRRLVVMIVSDW